MNKERNQSNEDIINEVFNLDGDWNNQPVKTINESKSTIKPSFYKTECPLEDNPLNKSSDEFKPVWIEKPIPEVYEQTRA